MGEAAQRLRELRTEGQRIRQRIREQLVAVEVEKGAPRVVERRVAQALLALRAVEADRAVDAVAVAETCEPIASVEEARRALRRLRSRGVTRIVGRRWWLSTDWW